nr:MAG TPA: hypothetical protein [Caudoviricetes sp.]
MTLQKSTRFFIVRDQLHFFICRTIFKVQS